jgi:hypothetical protein
MNSRIGVSVLCFWLFFPAFRPILCCCVHMFDATVTPPSFASMAHHLRSPSGQTTFVRPRLYLRRKSRRDKPSRYGSFEELHLGHPTIVEATGPPPPSVRLRQHLRQISRRDKLSRYGSFEKLHFGHTTRRPSGMIGLWARPIPSHHLGSSIGQAFQSHLFGRHHSLHDACGPRANQHFLRRRCLSRCLPTLFGRRQPRMRARPGLLSGCVLLLRYRHQSPTPRYAHRSSYHPALFGSQRRTHPTTSPTASALLLGSVLEDGLSHVGRSLLFSWRAVSLGEAAVVVLVVDYRYPFCLCLYLYIWIDVRLGPDHRVYWRGRGGFPFRGRRRVAVGGVGDGETGSISLDS